MALQAFWLVLAGPTIYTKSGGLADTVSGHTGRQFRKHVLEREKARSRLGLGLGLCLGPKAADYKLFSLIIIYNQLGLFLFLCF